MKATLTKTLRRLCDVEVNEMLCIGFPRVEKMKTLIVGSGKVGATLLNLLPISEAYATTTSAEKHESDSRLLLLDALDANSFKQLVEQIEPDCIVLGVAPNQSGMEDSDYRMFFLKVAFNAVASLNGTQHLIYLGSSALYGNHGGALVDETSLALATTVRGSTQNAAQQIVLGYARSTVLRLGGLCSQPGRALVLPKYTAPSFGTAERTLNFTNIEDAAGAALFTIEQGEAMYGAYNVSKINLKAAQLMPNVTQWLGGSNEWTESDFVLSSALIESKGFRFKHL